ncbi:hypothetical protein [Paenibacillus senegalensis]|uniref:hypothetical protein n=1 Tax=Paenibacillus senegalensis TaxID=1465766 RepID=UPI0002DA8ACE|nr:hypothetical protein [Paenibacillus senegalensis]
MNKQSLRSLLLIVSIVLFLIVGIQTVTALTHNHNLTRNFVHDPETYDYKNAMMDGRINVGEVERLFPTAEAPLGYDLNNVIRTPVKIRYYDAIGDQSPAYVIEEGEPVHVKKDRNTLSVKVGYGLDSVPADAAGWRMAYPFSADSGTSNELLYVRSEDLLKIARSWVNANEFIVQRGKQLGLSKNNTIQRLTLQVDHQLYDSGVYLSPDLYASVFPASSVILLALAIFSGGASLFLHRYQGKV